MFLTYQNGIVKTSVRRLVEFLFRYGDITPGDGAVADLDAMQEGSRLHKKIQKKQKATYRPEVSLKMSWEQEEYILELQGRADGIDRREEIYYIDEIKCVYKDVSNIEKADPVHLAQAKCYAYIYAKQQGQEAIGVQITYCNRKTEEIRYLFESYEFKELEEWFLTVLDSYRMWADYYIKRISERSRSIQSLVFPFEFRKGQKTMTAMIYRTIEQKQKVFLQAPTGIGKTISTLYPALKSMVGLNTEKIFYLTAKTITRLAAEEALTLLKENHLKITSVSLTGKEKICCNDVFVCDPVVCSRAKGHYDRINEAIYRLLSEQDGIRRETILRYAKSYQVCPYALSFEAANWADVLICDYNYVFDPHVSLSSLLSDQKENHQIYLIDEAHNLLDRSREMYSAVIALEQFDLMRKVFQGKSRRILREISACKKILNQWKDQLETKEHEALESADSLFFPLSRLCGDLQEYFSEYPELDHQEETMEIYFQWRHFLLMMEQTHTGYQIYMERKKKSFRVKLFCVDPSSQIMDYLGQNNTAIFFSATLLPIHYYRKLLCADRAMAYGIPYPFSEKNCLRVITNDVTSRYKSRNLSMYERILTYVETAFSVKPGNYMIFFPSYDMMNEVFELTEERTISHLANLQCQKADMTEREREEFLESFCEDVHKPVIGFCVMGSIYSEGIDLTGNRLFGAFIVGTGLPGISYEGDLIQQYFEKKEGAGYDYAYRYPGINKVLQAAGRVIRTATDVGMVVLMDDRFLWKENLTLLSKEWDHYYETDQYNFRAVMEHFFLELKNGEGEKDGV